MSSLNLRICDNPTCCTRPDSISPEVAALVDRTVGALLGTEAKHPGFLQEVIRTLGQQCGSTTLAPTSGRRTRWVPGIIRPPHVFPETLLQERNLWYCSNDCFDASQPVRDEHKARIHAACESKPHVPGSALDPETLRKAELRIVTIQRVRPELMTRQIEDLAIKLMDTPDVDIQIAIEATMVS